MQCLQRELHIFGFSRIFRSMPQFGVLVIVILVCLANHYYYLFKVSATKETNSKLIGGISTFVALKNVAHCEKLVVSSQSADMWALELANLYESAVMVEIEMYDFTYPYTPRAH